MELSKGKETALLSWINDVCPEEPVSKIIQMKDGHQLQRFICKVQGKASCDVLFAPAFAETIEMIITVLQDDFHFSRRQSFLISQKINQGIDLELQLAKVVLVLCYCGFKENNLVPDLDVKTELMIASMFRFVKEDGDGLSLDEGLDKFLTKDSVLNLSSGSESSMDSPFYTGDGSRFFGPPRVHFQRPVTCNPSSSPVQDSMNTAHFQLKRLQKELEHEGNMRDELEEELANQISIIAEKEGLIYQLQHRVDLLMQKIKELEKDHNATQLELQEKNDSLLHRVRELVKQCQDFKTSCSQNEKKSNELTEENVTLAAQVRNAFTQLSRAKEEIAKLTLAYEMSQSVWKDKREFLEKEFHKAVTHREVLNEQVQILQGKISVLEDELQKAQFQERGEVLGPSLDALTQIESLQTQILGLSDQISLKDEEIRHLKKECEALDHELKSVKEQNVEINGMIKSIRKDHEETIKKLQQELCSASSTASKKHEEVVVLSAEVTCLKEQICQYNENELQKQQEFSVLETQNNMLKENMTSLQNQLDEVTATTVQKEAERLLLQQEICHQETLRKTAQELQTVKCEEFKKTVAELQAKIHEVSSLASEREASVSSLQDEIKDQERLRAKLELKVKKQSESILALKNIARKWEQQCKELLEKLKKTSHQYCNNKQQLVEAQEMNKSLENSLEISRREVKALETQLTLARMERDREKAKGKHLETQVNFSDRRLQEQRRMIDDVCVLRVTETWQDTSADQSEHEFNDVLDVNSHWAAAGETRTPRTPESVEAEESFSNLHSAQNQRNVPTQRFKPVSTKLFKENSATATLFKTNKLKEDEPKHAADDWMRIAELQARNKACLPHLKSSYPLECRPNMKLPSFTVTDDDLRMGDPQETIQRAASHQRASQHTRSPHTCKRPASQQANAPEVERTSCFSQMTKGRFANSKKRHLNSQIKEQQSVMFTIPNTPKLINGGSLLHRGNIRNDACKSATESIRALRSTTSSANSRSPQVSALRKTSHSRPLRSSNVKKMSTIN